MHQLAANLTWDPFPPDLDDDDASHRRAANRAIAISAVGLALTGLVEVLIAVLGGSVGLLGDGLHNLSDVSTSLVVFFGFWFSRRPASPSRPYGWNRAEDLAGLGVAAVVWASAVFAGVVSVHKLGEHGHTSALGLGMAAAVVGMLGNQLVARYKRRVGTRIRSATLLADAKHSWLDALASAGALLGLIGVAAGLPWADGVAGLAVTAFIVHVAWELTSELVIHLLDGVEPEVVTRAEERALSVPGVTHVHVRARWAGRSLIIEVEGFLLGTTSLEEAEGIGQRVRARIEEAVPGTRSVLWSPHALAPNGPAWT